MMKFFGIPTFEGLFVEGHNKNKEKAQEISHSFMFEMPIVASVMDSYQRLLQNGTFVMNLDAAAIGFSALRSLSPERAIYLASAMQNAFYQDGKSLSDPATYQEIRNSLFFVYD